MAQREKKRIVLRKSIKDLLAKRVRLSQICLQQVIVSFNNTVFATREPLVSFNNDFNCLIKKKKKNVINFFLKVLLMLKL